VTHDAGTTSPAAHEEIAMDTCLVKGRTVPQPLLGELRDASPLLDDPAALRARLAEDGYLFLKGALDADAVRAARAEVFGRLHAVDEVRSPPELGIFTGTSRRTELEPDRGRFWRSVSQGPRLRAVSHAGPIAGVMQAVFGERAVPQDYLFLRAGVRGRATDLHYDYPFFSRAHDRVCTVWTPLGDVPVSDGPLVVVEGSHRYRDLIDPMIGHDISADPARRAAFGSDAIDFAAARGTRLLTRDFEAGDVIVFGMYIAHGSLDNDSPIDRVRLSCDVRWQPASMPRDERYFGDDPPGTTGEGYAELNGAKPLTQDWHVR
jgi:ectoine hydroxylase-related dioxygenase (phytanoyl-CoA dioxygenase family)